MRGRASSVTKTELGNRAGNLSHTNTPARGFQDDLKTVLINKFRTDQELGVTEMAKLSVDDAWDCGRFTVTR